MDNRIVEYMKKRAEFSNLIACAYVVQALVLAAFFSAYALMFGDISSFTGSDTAKLTVICCMVVCSVGLCVFNVMVCIRYGKLCEIVPDSIAMRESRETANFAYLTVRPILIRKITGGIVFILCGGLLYILLMIFMEHSFLSEIYGRVAVFIATSLGVLLGYPAFDRIEAYRDILNETHKLMHNTDNKITISYTVAVALPISICVWYILRFFSPKYSIAWIVFPFAALICLATGFLICWTRSDIVRNNENH